MTEKREATDTVRQVEEPTQLRLEAHVRGLEERVRTNDQMQAMLLEQIAELEATSRTLTARCLQMEQLNANLANLYVASYRIHGSLERIDVLDTLREILINVVGTEQFAIFEREGTTSTLRPVSSLGVDDARLLDVRLGEAGLGAYIACGEPYVPSYDAERTSLTRDMAACVPLRVGDRVVGAIVVYRLLSHKAALEESDLELLNLLATHAATALYCSELHERARFKASA